MSDLVLQDTKNQAWKDDKSRFGFKMLQKMGWKEDKGLGKNDSGSVASIKVSKREEGLGLGMEKVKQHVIPTFRIIFSSD
jgi:Pin2-interacting protein X1